MTVKTNQMVDGNRNYNVGMHKMLILWRNCVRDTLQVLQRTIQVKITITISTPPLITITQIKAISPNKITPIIIRPNLIKALSDLRWVAPSDNTTLLATLYRETPNRVEQSSNSQQNDQSNDKGEETTNKEGMSKETLQFEEALKQWVNR